MNPSTHATLVFDPPILRAVKHLVANWVRSVNALFFDRPGTESIALIECEGNRMTVDSIKGSLKEKGIRLTRQRELLLELIEAPLLLMAVTILVFMFQKRRQKIRQ